MRLVLPVLAIVGLAACGTEPEAGPATEPDAVAMTSAPSSPPTSPGTSTTTTGPPATTASTVAPTVSLLPLPEMHPRLTVRADDRDVAEIALLFDAWDDQSVFPPFREPTGGVVVPAGSDVTFDHPWADAVDVEIVRLGAESRFAPVDAIDQAGIYAVAARATFPPSDRYAGSGALRATLWVQVVPAGAPCITDGPGSTEVTGLLDDDGCPADADATLNVQAVLPWFHCNPWPPTIRWDGHPTASHDSFQRVEPVVGKTEPDVGDLPTDAMPAGFALPAGEVMTSASDPDALFVRLGDGRAERWTPPELEVACA